MRGGKEELKHNETEYFLKKFTSAAKQYAEQSAINKYPQCQNKNNPWKIVNIQLVSLEKNEDNVHNLIIDYKCVFDVQEKPDQQAGCSIGHEGHQGFQETAGLPGDRRNPVPWHQEACH